MQIELNLDIELVVEDGCLVVRLVSTGPYPYFEKQTVAASAIPLNDLKDYEP